MALDDMMETEVGVAVAATAMATSPRVRSLLHQGAVYGLAGALKAGDLVYGAARGVVRGATSGIGGNDAAPSDSSTRDYSSTRSPSTRSPSTRSSSGRSRTSPGGGTRRTTSRPSAGNG